MYYYFKANNEPATANNCDFSISDSNKKLFKDVNDNGENIRFLIWNLPAVTTCPYRTPACEVACYARKSEKNYPTVLPSRTRNYEFSKTADFEKHMIKAINYICNTTAYKKAEKIYFRIHESGDFYNLEYTKAWMNIASWCNENIPNIEFVAYTKSFKFIIECSNAGLIPSNVNILKSLWDDTSDLQLARMAKLPQFPVYTAIPEIELNNAKNNGLFICECKNCAKCGKCYELGNNKTIACVIH